VVNPIRGIEPGSPSVLQGHESSKEDRIDRELETGNTEWQKEAANYVKESITPESCYKLKKFVTIE